MHIYIYTARTGNSLRPPSRKTRDLLTEFTFISEFSPLTSRLRAHTPRSHSIFLKHRWPPLDFVSKHVPLARRRFELADLGRSHDEMGRESETMGYTKKVEYKLTRFGNGEYKLRFI